MTFTLRTILGVVVLNLLVLMAVVKIGIGALDRANTNELIKHAQSTAEYLATATKPFLVSRDFDSLSAAVEEFTSNPSVAYARLLDRDGKIVVDSRAIKDKSLTVFDLEQLPRDENIFHVNANVADGASYFGKVELGINRNSIDSVSREVLIEYAMVGALGIAASIFVSFLFTRQMTHRLRQLVKGTKELIVHGKEIVLPDKGRDEVAETAKSFNQLAQRIQTQKSEFETITAASMDCIILADEGGKIIHFNSHAKKTFGYKPEDVLGKSMVEMLIPPNMRSAQEARIKNYLATRNSSLLGERVRILAQRSNGSQFPAELLIRAAEHGEGITFVIYLRDRTEIHDAEAKLDDLAYKDDITGLPNRVLLRDRLKQAMIEADSRDRLVAVVLLDLDRFKNINDSLGHEKGDLLIQEVANRLLSTVRRGDTIARLGGDEFVLVMADIAEAEDVHKVAQKIIDRVAEPIYIGDMELFVSVSIGIAFYPVDDIEVDDLLKNADTAMYRSKSMGGGCYQYYSSEMSSQVQDKLTMENALRHALDRNELLLYYQPQVDLKTGNIYGMEALIRWEHPEKGMVDPSKFIPIAEETSLISSIGEWVIMRACEQNLKFLAKGFPPLRVSINVSTRQFSEPDFVSKVKRILKQTGHSPSLLDIEITESMLTVDTEDVIRKLQALSKLGIKISLDDFGTGYSSLSYLKRLPIDTLKIDRSFVNDLGSDPDDASIVNAILKMSKSLGLETVAEGVEDETQLAFLAKAGCDRIQGYYFSKPLSFKEFARFLRDGKQFNIPLLTSKKRTG